MAATTPGVDLRIREKARELGADLVGLASASSVIDLPSHRISTAAGGRVDGEDAGRPVGPGSVQRPDSRWKTIVVLALWHPESRPELDYFSFDHNTPGNGILLGIVRDLVTWLNEEEALDARSLPYGVERGGVYLKDAGVQAGLGCIGRNNLLVTPEFGPRVRLRGLIVDAEADWDAPIRFDPCASCREYCRAACPRGALDDVVELPDGMAPSRWPARDGHYKRSRCMTQMNADRAAGGGVDRIDGECMEKDRPGVDAEYPVIHCRRCELSCPVGLHG